MSSMVLTQVYLEASQKKALASQAKKTGRKVSEIMRDAVDAAIAGVTLEEIQTLDMGTQRAQSAISAMLVDLKENTNEHTSFMREISKLQKAAAKDFA
jgi:Ribbon-helix-helix protein, copG family